jgi:radical SAM protein with 4Fe4S-binding SPASM domain
MTKPLCYAPLGNLLFQPDGSVYACHYNRGYILGKYPDNNISEIWSSSKRKLMAESLKRGLFGEGCDTCSLSYENNIYTNAANKNYDQLKSKSYLYPKQFEFQISNVCNMECLVCSGEYSAGIRANREKLAPYPNPYDDNFIKELIPFINHLKHAGFTGGEPFLNELYYKIWDLIKKLNKDIVISISSNGSIWNKKIEDALNGLKTRITISTDSLNPEIYSTIRKNGNLNKVLSNIERILEIREDNNIDLTIKFLVMPVNMMSIPELFTYFNNKNVYLAPKFVQHPLLASLQILPPAEIAESIDLLNKNISCLQDKTHIQKLNINRYKDMIKQLEGWKTKSLFEKKNKLDNMNCEQLREQLDKSLKEFCINNNDIQAYSECNNSLDYILGKLDNTFQIRNVLVSCILSPVYLIANEFQRENKETIFARAMQNACLKNENMSIHNTDIHY